MIVTASVITLTTISVKITSSSQNWIVIVFFQLTSSTLSSGYTEMSVNASLFSISLLTFLISLQMSDKDWQCECGQQFYSS